MGRNACLEEKKKIPSGPAPFRTVSVEGKMTDRRSRKAPAGISNPSAPWHPPHPVYPTLDLCLPTPPLPAHPQYQALSHKCALSLPTKTEAF